MRRRSYGRYFHSLPGLALTFGLLAALGLMLLVSNFASAPAPLRQGSPPAVAFPPHPNNPSAEQAIAALDLDPAHVVSVDFGTSDHTGLAVDSPPLTGFPIQGNSFLVMSSGCAAAISLPNDSEGTTCELAGLDQSQGNDMVQMTIVLTPPPGASSFKFDWRLFSEEFPEFVGTPFNDAFLVETPASTFTISIDPDTAIPTITADNNIAYDSSGNSITINSIGAFGMSEANAAGTTYDGATSAFTTIYPFAAGASSLTFVFSIMDLSDDLLDTTVILDNLRWGNETGDPVTLVIPDPPPPAPITATLADTWVESQFMYSDRGKATTLGFAKSYSREWRPVFRFSTAGLAPGFTSAFLKLFVYDEGMEPDDRYRVHVQRILASYVWTEGNANQEKGCVAPELCWATYPGASFVREHGDYLDVGGWVDDTYVMVPVSGALAGSMADGEATLSIALVPERLGGVANDLDEIIFRSKEVSTTSHRPVLVVRYGTTEVVAPAQADTWVNSGPILSDRGLEAEFQIGKSSWQETRAVLRFPTASTQPGFASAYLKLFVSSEQMESDDRYRIHVQRIVESFAWMEGDGKWEMLCVQPEMCWATYPGPEFLRSDGDFLDNVKQPAAGTYMLIPVTNALARSLADGESSLSIVLLAERLAGGDSLDQIVFRSKEATDPAQRPALVVNYN
jgi:hypothetical protein